MFNFKKTYLEQLNDFCKTAVAKTVPNRKELIAENYKNWLAKTLTCRRSNKLKSKVPFFKKMKNFKLK